MWYSTRIKENNDCSNKCNLKIKEMTVFPLYSWKMKLGKQGHLKQLRASQLPKNLHPTST